MTGGTTSSASSSPSEPSDGAVEAAPAAPPTGPAFAPPPAPPRRRMPGWGWGLIVAGTAIVALVLGGTVGGALGFVTGRHLGIAGTAGHGWTVHAPQGGMDSGSSGRGGMGGFGGFGGRSGESKGGAGQGSDDAKDGRSAPSPSATPNS